VARQCQHRRGGGRRPTLRRHPAGHGRAPRASVSARATEGRIRPESPAHRRRGACGRTPSRPSSGRLAKSVGARGSGWPGHHPESPGVWAALSSSERPESGAIMNTNSSRSKSFRTAVQAAGRREGAPGGSTRLCPVKGGFSCVCTGFIPYSHGFIPTTANIRSISDIPRGFLLASSPPLIHVSRIRATSPGLTMIDSPVVGDRRGRGRGGGPLITSEKKS
jgi:hypothetical protein